MSERSSNAPRSLPRTPGRRAERRLAAAEAALVAGDITGTNALAGQAALNLTQPLTLARTRRLHGLCLQTQGRTAEAVRTLIDAALEMGTADPGCARDTMLEAFGAAQLDGWFGAGERRGGSGCASPAPAAGRGAR